MSIKPIFSLVILLFLFESCTQTNEQLVHEAIQVSKQKKYDKAIEIYTKVINRNNKLQVAYYNRGLDYLAIKKYNEALADFNKVMSLQKHGDAIITYNTNTPYADEEARAQVPYYDALYQRAQVKYCMDSLKGAFIDFQTLIDNNYEGKSNCILWQGTIYIKSGKIDKACDCFDKAKQFALNEDNRKEADEMIKTYCGIPKNNP